MVEESFGARHIDYSFCDIWQFACTSLFFSIYSVFAIPVNVFVLWTIPLLMILGEVASLLSFVSDIFTMPFPYASIPFLSFFLWVTQIFPQNFEMQVTPFPLHFVLGKVIKFESS